MRGRLGQPQCLEGQYKKKSVSSTEDRPTDRLIATLQFSTILLSSQIKFKVTRKGGGEGGGGEGEKLARADCRIKEVVAE